VKINTENRIIEYRPKTTPKQLLNEKHAKEFLYQILKDIGKLRKTYPYETWSYRINVEGNEEVKSMLRKIEKWYTTKALIFLSLLGYSGIPTSYLIYLKLLGESSPNIIDFIVITSGMVLTGISSLGVIHSVKKELLLSI